MFTGIVTDIGEVVAVEPRAEGLARLKIACGYDPDAIDIGASIAAWRMPDRGRAWQGRQPRLVRGRCRRRDAARDHDQAGGRARASISSALKIGDELGGHIVAGHADGLALVLERRVTDMARFTFRAPAELARFIAPKGSVALDGVSLTVNEVAGDAFSVLIIPHTLAVTTLAALAVGDGVNLGRSDGALRGAADGAAVRAATAARRPAMIERAKRWARR
jgi:riboflavin synthase